MLKAAVMKYGLNQWARVASVLPTKTSRQCKCRWFAWLDPGIRKREWVRSEDECLLHVVRIFPRQWQTISPVVGRTVWQCIERYNRLVEIARMTSKEKSLSGFNNIHQDYMEVRDSARPDSQEFVTLDSQILSEVRSRLANTKGKKAKRRAREAMLDSSRRLASFQKQSDIRKVGLGFTDRYSFVRDPGNVPV